MSANCTCVINGIQRSIYAVHFYYISTQKSSQDNDFVVACYSISFIMASLYNIHYAHCTFTMHTDV